MNTLLLAIISVVAVYLLIVVILPRSLRGESTAYTQRTLDRIFKENTEQATARTAENSSLLRGSYSPQGLSRIFFSLPGMQSMYALMLKAGLEEKSHIFVLLLIGLWVLFSFIGFRIGVGALGVLAAAALALFLGQMYLKRRVKKRNEQFINMFPDALDMIVRSVRSGFPLNTALRMIAENMDPPVGTEFKQVVDEIAFGRSMSEALQRLSQRIDEADIQFFVVVLNVQQEAGGNLAEILSNLANIIRKRKQLRLKIKALTSEGRATGWVLGLLPVFVFVVLMFASPTHLEPLFDTEPGRILLGLAISMVLLAGWIVRQMIQIDI